MAGYNCGVKSVLRVASPPPKPLLVYDGDCNFCTLWIRRWQGVTGDRVDYLPFQDQRVEAQFPEVPRDRFESAVQLVLPDGAVLCGAEAVFRSLAFNPHGRWWLDWYEHSPAFARVSEWGYGFVARHRTGFSFLTRLLWGRHLEPPTQVLLRWIFLRLLGVVYLIAFVSLWVQVPGLIGSEGIVPAGTTMQLVRNEAAAAHLGINRYHLVPTLCWISASDSSLQIQCAAGTALAVLVIIGIAPALCLFLLWLIYLSLTTVGGVFLGFQWDNLLLETGLLAVFFAPLQWLPRKPGQEAPPSRIALWLLRWLLFRLMFESGCVKLLSGDPTWRHLTALHFHFDTQPLPTWIGWYAYQLPAGLQKTCTAAMFVIELLVPFLIFAPRRPRQFACAALVLFQVAILLTGNYGFFNLLTIVLCLTLLDDAALKRRRLGRLWPGADCEAPAIAAFASPGRRWAAGFTLPLAIIVFAVSFVQLLGMFRVRLPGPRPVLAGYQWLLPLRSFNSYGLFAVMTTSRPEIVVEGSNDGVQWAAYEFKYKPGSVRRRPGFVAPYQPRLDWQMWFAALGDYRQNPWFVSFCSRLLQGSPEVLALLARNPFPNAPPRYIRAVVYDYRFTHPATRRQTGDWWQRELRGVYLPPVSLSETREASGRAPGGVPRKVAWCGVREICFQPTGLPPPLTRPSATRSQPMGEGLGEGAWPDRHAGSHCKVALVTPR
jgi:predicted DCC family thiol-disulfide oxidoreductase YuxK